MQGYITAMENTLTRISFLIYIFFLERLLNFKVLLKHDDAVIS